MKPTNALALYCVLMATCVSAWDLTYEARTAVYEKAQPTSSIRSGSTGTSGTSITSGSADASGSSSSSSSLTSPTISSSSFSGYFNSSSAITAAGSTTADTTDTTDTTTSSSSWTLSTSPAATFIAAILAEHNAKRALHGSPDLTWNDDLAEYAQNYVTNGYDACSGSLEHSGAYYGVSSGYGENLALGYTPVGAVDGWYAEIDNYNWDDPEGGSTGEIGHFTQVVWNTTTELGCAYVYCGSYWNNYVVCEYYPPGNIVGTYAEHVPPLLSS